MMIYKSGKVSFLLFFSIIISINLFGQQSSKLKMIIDLNGNDTLKIQKFDKKQRLIFWKSFPQYGMSQILTYTYENDKLINYTWSHSKHGFVISDYKYDSLSNTRRTYCYESKKEGKELKNLMTYQNTSDLHNSQQYIDLKISKNRYLNEIAFLQDTLVVKEIEFNSKGDTVYITDYSYEIGLLKSRKQLYKRNNHFNKIVYEYDNKGNEIQWTKFFDLDTAYVYKKEYVDNKLVEQKLYEDKSLSSITKFEYSNGLLKFKKKYDSKNILKNQKEYFYNELNLIDKIVCYDRTIHYVYE